MLISSHILSELGELCDTVAVIEAGRLVATGSVDSVLREMQPHLGILVRALADEEDLRRALLEQPRVESVRPAREGRGGLVVDFVGELEQTAELLEALVRAGLRPVEFAPQGANLEDVFLSLTEGKLQ